jgi:hypothetical protein
MSSGKTAQKTNIDIEDTLHFKLPFKALCNILQKRNNVIQTASRRDFIGDDET